MLEAERNRVHGAFLLLRSAGALELIVATRLLGAGIATLLFVLRLREGHRIVAEDRDGARHVADLVLLGEARHFECGVAFRETEHRRRERHDRPDDAAPHEQTHRHRDQEDERDRRADQGQGAVARRLELPHRALLALRGEIHELRHGGRDRIEALTQRV